MFIPETWPIYWKSWIHKWLEKFVINYNTYSKIISSIMMMMNDLFKIINKLQSWFINWIVNFFLLFNNIWNCISGISLETRVISQTLKTISIILYWNYNDVKLTSYLPAFEIVTHNWNACQKYRTVIGICFKQSSVMPFKKILTELLDRSSYLS